MNWGYKILITYFIFIGGILFLVIRSSSEKTDLVTSDYYAQELKYQQKIDESKNTDALTAEPDVIIKGDQLIIHFPNDFLHKKIQGNILLYCPSDEKRDVKQSFDREETDVNMTIPVVNKGLHELHISWEADGVKYYFEKKIFI